MTNSEANTLRAEVKALYLKIEDKATLKSGLSEKHDVSPVTVRQNWFAGSVVGIPKAKLNEVINDIREILKKQEDVTTTA